MVRARLGDYETWLTYSDSSLSNGERARELGAFELSGRLFTVSEFAVCKEMWNYNQLYLSFNV